MISQIGVYKLDCKVLTIISIFYRAISNLFFVKTSIKEHASRNIFFKNRALNTSLV
jgi:hypothetical protein